MGTDSAFSQREAFTDSHMTSYAMPPAPVPPAPPAPSEADRTLGASSVRSFDMPPQTVRRNPQTGSASFTGSAAFSQAAASMTTPRTSFAPPVRHLSREQLIESGRIYTQEAG